MKGQSVGWRLPEYHEGSVFHWNQLKTTEGKKEGGQSSKVKAGFEDCPYGKEGSWLYENHLWGSADKNLIKESDTVNVHQI